MDGVQISRNPLAATSSALKLAVPVQEPAAEPPSPASPAGRSPPPLRRQPTGLAVSSKGVPLVSHGVMTGFLGKSSRNLNIGVKSDPEPSGPTPEAVDLALQFVRDALTGRSPNTRLARAAGVMGDSSTAPVSRAETIIRHRAYRIAIQCIALVHCLLAFFEDIPPSPATPPASWVVGAIEFACIAAYIADQALVLWAYGWHHYADKKWEGVFGVISVLALLDWILYYPAALRSMFRFSRPLRPIFGIAKRSGLRRLLSSMFWTVPALLDVSLLLGVAVCFFSMLGMQLFNRGQVPGYSTSNDHFDDWISSVLAIYVLTTTENYPNVANPAFAYRPYVAGVFFVFALFTLLWLVLPLVLARLYDFYKDIHAQAARALRVKQYASLVFGYQALMGGDGDAEMPREVFRLVAQGVNGRLSRRQTDVLFDLLDIDRSGAITVAEFLRLPAALAVARRLPDLPEAPGAMSTTASSEPLRQQLWDFAVTWSRRATRSRVFRVLAGASIVGACVSACLWTWDAQSAYDACVCAAATPPPSDDNAPNGDAAPLVGADGGCVGGSTCTSNLVFVGYTLSLVFAVLQAVELAVRVIGHGSSGRTRTTRGRNPCVDSFCGWARWTWLLSSGWHMMAAIIVVLNLVAAPLVFFWPASTALSPGFREVLQIVRSLVFLRLLELQPRLRFSVSIIVNILPVVLRFTVVYAGITYGFATIGVTIFGAVQQPPPLLCQNCQLYQFSTMVEALLALLQVTVGNNWNSILYPLIDATSWWSSWYLIIFRFTMTDAVVSLIEAVMIEAFQAAQLSRAGEEAEKGRLAEAVRRESMVGGDDMPDFASPSLTAPPVGELDKLQAELFADVAAAEAQADVGDGPSPTAGSGWDGTRVVVGIPRSELALLAQALRGHEQSLDRRNRGVAQPPPVPAPATARTGRPGASGGLLAPLIPAVPSPMELQVLPSSSRANDGAVRVADRPPPSPLLTAAVQQLPPPVKDWT